MGTSSLVPRHDNASWYETRVLLASLMHLIESSHGQLGPTPKVAMVKGCSVIQNLCALCSSQLEGFLISNCSHGSQLRCYRVQI